MFSGGVTKRVSRDATRHELTRYAFEWNRSTEWIRRSRDDALVTACRRRFSASISLHNPSSQNFFAAGRDDNESFGMISTRMKKIRRCIFYFFLNMAAPWRKIAKTSAGQIAQSKLFQQRERIFAYARRFYRMKRYLFATIVTLNHHNIRKMQSDFELNESPLTNPNLKPRIAVLRICTFTQLHSLSLRNLSCSLPVSIAPAEWALARSPKESDCTTAQSLEQ